jgi:hypothetical protein
MNEARAWSRSSQAARIENRIGVRNPAGTGSATISGKNAHPNLLHLGPALVSSNRLGRYSRQQRCLRDR